MRYVSTRGAAPALDFEAALLAGLASDGGLYVPERWPALAPADLRRLGGLGYAEAAARIMEPFVGSSFTGDELAGMARQAYASFRHPAVAPLRQLDANDWLLELTHGPTLAFKDYALQLVALMFDRVLARRGERLTILGATSGDTGAAAIAACEGRDRLEVFILFPEGRVSETQRRQMTTVAARNIHTLAIAGTFDDCQDIVKALFADGAFRDEVNLAAVNSINWARVMAQTVYYVTAAVAIGAPERKVAFSVPSGNFGNVFAGYAAARMGLPVDRLIVASNRNDVLTRFFDTGVMQPGTVHPTLSPSMDIQISSNFERFLFELYDRDGGAVGALVDALRRKGRFEVPSERLARAKKLFAAAWFDDDETLETIGRIHTRTGILVDPHTAVGILAAAARRPAPEVPVISLSTADPAKFPETVARACGVRPALPPALGRLHERPERQDLLPNDADAVRRLIQARLQGPGR
ncbi:MAG TPA: threonine synthase [Alphaproteobacteria bacterium]|nr:threonine synthase [Alphaproteobacteria bacterium]